MDVTVTEEQRELGSIVRSLLAKRADSAAVRAAMGSEGGFDAGLWQTLCEQVGVAALPVPEEYGGAGFSLVESAVVLEELGRSLAPSPALPSLLAAEALLAAGDDAACGGLLPRIAAGEVATVALAPENVLFGAQAEIVLAVVDGSLVEVDPSVGRTSTPAVDPTLQLATLDLAAASTTVLSEDPAVADRVRQVALAATAALQVGGMQRALDDTVAYGRQRVQFGRPIGSFQALKHRMADMLVALEMSRSAALAAARAVAAHDEEADRLTRAAASWCSESFVHLAGEMVQLHGGIAITWEHDAHLVLKRAHALGQLFGRPHEHRASLV